MSCSLHSNGRSHAIKVIFSTTWTCDRCYKETESSVKRTVTELLWNIWWSEEASQGRWRSNSNESNEKTCHKFIWTAASKEWKQRGDRQWGVPGRFQEEQTGCCSGSTSRVEKTGRKWDWIGGKKKIHSEFYGSGQEM